MSKLRIQWTVVQKSTSTSLHVIESNVTQLCKFIEEDWILGRNEGSRYYGYARKNFFRLARTVLRERVAEIRLRIVNREIPDGVLLKKSISVRRFLPQLSIIGILFPQSWFFAI